MESRPPDSSAPEVRGAESVRSDVGAWQRAVVDSRGRVLIPKHIRDEVGLTPGVVVEISRHGGGVDVEPADRRAPREP